MSLPINPGRVTASTSHAFVLFRIGMRFNGWRGLAAAVRTFTLMPPMIGEQSADPTIGMLWSSAALSWPVIHLTQIWRSAEDLERYAKAPGGRHTGAWRWFNQLAQRGLGTGIWHETYRIAAGSYEAVYVNMPSYGIAAALTGDPAARDAQAVPTIARPTTLNVNAVADEEATRRNATMDSHSSV